VARASGCWRNVAGPVASFAGDGAYDQDRVYAGVAQRHAQTAPTQGDGRLQHIATHGRMAWQRRSGYTKRARVEATMGRCKQVIGDALRAHTDQRRAAEVAVAVHAFNLMQELGRPSYVRIA